MDKDLSAFGEGTPSTGKNSLFFPAVGEKKKKIMVTHHFTVTRHTWIVNSWWDPLLIVYHLDSKKSKIKI